MKIVQFIHPMFLAALGLHITLMFVPIGNDAEPELIEEDVPLAELTSELTEDASRATPSRLSASDPNVSSDAVAKTAAGAAKTGAKTAANVASTGRIPPRRSAPRKVVATGTPAQITPTGNVRPAGSATPSTPASPSSPAATNASSSGSATSDTAGGTETTANANGSQTQSTDDVTTPVVSNPPISNPPISNPPTPEPTTNNTDTTDVDAGLIGSSAPDDIDVGLIGAHSSSEADDNSTANGTSAEGDRLASLIDSDPRKIEPSNELGDLVLKLAQGLQYQPEGTDDESAMEVRDRWIDTVSLLASRTNAIERVEPIVISDRELVYPIASSVLRKGRSLDVCLDKAPSTAEVGLLFNAQGELALEPTLLRSTGYPALNMEVIESFKEIERLPSDRSSKAYIFEISMDYDKDNCVNLSELQSSTD